MELLKQWSELYGIPIPKLRGLLESSNPRVIADRSITSRILRRNSEIVQGFLETLPEPRKEKRAAYAVAIDFIFPNKEGFKQIFQAKTTPLERFEGTDDMSMFFFTRTATMVCPISLDTLDPQKMETYVQAIARYHEGMQLFTKRVIADFLKDEYLIYSAKVGLIRREFTGFETFSPSDMNMDKIVLSYTCKQGPYNPSSRIISKDLDAFFSLKNAHTLEREIEKTNSLFFTRNRNGKKR